MAVDITNTNSRNYFWLIVKDLVLFPAFLVALHQFPLARLDTRLGTVLHALVEGLGAHVATHAEQVDGSVLAAGTQSHQQSRCNKDRNLENMTLRIVYKRVAIVGGKWPRRRVIVAVVAP